VFAAEWISVEASERVTMFEVYWASVTLDQRCWFSSSAAPREICCAFQIAEYSFSPIALHRSNSWLHLCAFFVSILGTYLHPL